VTLISSSTNKGLTEHQRQQQEAFESDEPISVNQNAEAIKKTTNKVVEKTATRGGKRMRIQEEYIGEPQTHLNYGDESY